MVFRFKVTVKRQPTTNVNMFMAYVGENSRTRKKRKKSTQQNTFHEIKVPTIIKNTYTPIENELKQNAIQRKRG